MRNHPIGRWVELVKFMLALGILVEVIDGTGDREHQGSLDAPQGDHSLLRVGVLIMKVTKVLCTPPWQEHPAVATDQHKKEETSE